MRDIIILGCTSNICAIRVFSNLNNIHNLINKIYCYGMEEWSTKNFLTEHFSKKVILKAKDRISEKIIFLNGEYNYKNYIKILYDKIKNDTIIYVATPPICYIDIIKFVNNSDTNCKLVLEKPLSTDYKNFLDIKKLLTNKIFIIDHFLYKIDIQNIINLYNDKKIKVLKIQFNYLNDVEDRLGYFDKTGFFVDMFQSHFLSIVYSLINKEIYDFLNMNIIKNVRKQYKNYGGKNKIDTYFYVEFKVNDNLYIFEAGKAMLKEEKKIIIDDVEFNINNYENEYELYFKDIITSKYFCKIIFQQELFWKISDLLSNNYSNKSKLEYYDKNKLKSILS